MVLYGEGAAFELRAICHFFFFHCIDSFLSVLDLHCCSEFSLVAQSGGRSLAVVCRLLTVIVALAAEHSF